MRDSWSSALVAAPLAVVLTTLGTVACGSESAQPSSDELIVFAASSLTEAFIAIGVEFEEANPGTDVTFNFLGSTELVAQLLQGAPAAVFVAADDVNMAKVLDAGENDGEPVVFAGNTFEIIVEPGNPQGIHDLADLADQDLIVVLCADSVPCGRGAATILTNAGVDLTPKSFDERVKGVVTKVTSGEADAGIVYVTDVLAVGAAADGVAIPAELNVINRYSAVVTRSAPNSAVARTFVDFVASARGQAILAAHGFLAP
ncbi:MAG: molybdate ABC transporter substrate-binding protein [Actinobacteria bacterium]|nr:molybdate ABC transporter substrate-binding protein [Actinomycetota bacterium]